MRYFMSIVNESAIFGALAAIQALLVNRLGLSLAAVPAFMGLGAYAFAAGGGVGLSLLAVGGASAFLMVFLADRLKRDVYLLATLAFIECLVAAASASDTLGGREGLAAWRNGGVGGPDFEQRMLPWTLGTVIAVALVIRGTLASAVGVAIDRMCESPATAPRWFPTRLVRAALVGGGLAGAMAIGALYAGYHGRVGPSVFSLEFAVLVLVFTVLAARTPELAVVAAMGYWLLPYVLTGVLSMSQRGAADLVRVAWGVGVITVAVAPQLRSARRAARLRASVEQS